MNRKLTVTFELIAIVAMLLFILWMGGVFTPPPPPTPTPTAFITSTPPPTPKPTLIPTPVGTLPPLTQATGMIAFTSNRDGNTEIYRMSADGSNQLNLTQNPAQDTLIDWSPDGTKLAFFSTRSNNWLELFVMNANGSNVLQLTHTFGTNTAYVPSVAWSPDGRYLLAIRTSPWQVEQYPTANTLDLISTDASAVTTLYAASSFVTQPTFSPDGHYLTLILQTNSGSGLYSSLFSEKPDFQLASHNCGSNYIWHPGENRLTCNSGASYFDLDPDGTNQKSVLADSAFIDFRNQAAWAPNNSQLLANFIGWGNAQPNSQTLTLIDPVTNHQTAIYRDKDMSTGNTFTWAPDSQWLAFVSKKSGQMDIYTLNIYLAQSPVPMQPLQLTGNTGDNYSPHWQPSSP